MTNEVYASLAYQKLIEFKSQIVNGIATKDVFVLCKDLMDLLKTTPGQAFGMSVIFRDFLHPIYTEIDIMDKTKIYIEVSGFNAGQQLYLCLKHLKLFVQQNL